MPPGCGVPPSLSPRRPGQVRKKRNQRMHGGGGAGGLHGTFGSQDAAGQRGSSDLVAFG